MVHYPHVAVFRNGDTTFTNYGPQACASRSAPPSPPSAADITSAFANTLPDVSTERPEISSASCESTYRVVYLTHIARLSGGEIALLRTLPALRGEVEAHVILGEDGPLVQAIEETGASVEVLPMPEQARDVRKDTVKVREISPRGVAAAVAYTFRMRRRIRELQPHLIHTNSLKAALYGGVAGRMAGVPVVWHIRDRIAPDYLPTAAVRLVRAAARVLPTVIVANSKTTLATLPSTRRGRVVTNAVVNDSIPATHLVASTSERPFRVGLVGRLSPWKGQDLFLKAFAEAFGQEENVEAWVVGIAMFDEHKYADSLPGLADRLGIADRVEFRGFHEDVWSELAQLDVLVHCSLIPEPFGQVVVEGMAAGVPVIAAAAGGPAEIITDGADGILMPPGDPHALAMAMRRLRDDPELRARLANAALETASRYTPENTAKQILDVYRQVLGR